VISIRKHGAPKKAKKKGATLFTLFFFFKLNEITYQIVSILQLTANILSIAGSRRNPLWSTSSVLTGLLSFMCEDEITTGAIRTSDAEKRRLAKESLEWNMKNPSFRRLFPSLETVAEQKQQQEQKQEQGEHEAAFTTPENQNGTGEAARAAAREDMGRREWLMERLLALVQRAQSILAFLVAAMGFRPRPQRA